MRTPHHPTTSRPDVSWRLDLVSAVVLLLAAVLVLHQLMLPPVVGYADNGDFGRVITPLGLTHSADPAVREFFYFVDPVYEWTEPASVEVFSTELILAGLAVGLHKIFGGGETFDLRLMGGVHAVLYLAGLYLILTGLQSFPRRVRWLAAVLLLLAAADSPYVIFLNSFYAEAASLVFLVLALGLLLRTARAHEGSHVRTVFYYLVVLLFALARAQNVWVALPLLAAPLLLGHAPRLPRARLLPAGLAVAVLVVAVALTWPLPEAEQEAARWDLLFNGILVVSPDPGADLAEFGLPPALAEHSGKGAWSAGIPRYETTAQYGLGDIARFHLRHPDRFLALAAAGARDCFRWEEGILASRTEVVEGPAGARAPSITGWGNFERNLFPGSLWFLGTVFVLATGAVVWGWRYYAAHSDGRRLFTTAGVLVALSLVAYVAAVAAEEPTGTFKHLFVFQVIFDVGLIALLGLGMDHLGRFFPGRWWESTAAVGREDRRRE
ncbi:MAG: hypothetical protein GY838_14415 [bacterium]|nr:hypothetical protein [bacterium]